MLSMQSFVSASSDPYYGLFCHFVVPVVQTVFSNEDFLKALRLIFIDVLQIH